MLKAPDMGFSESVREELHSARQQHPGEQHSFHEGYAVLLEEVEEVWDEVKLKSSLRNRDKMLHELVQVGAMAQRMAEDNGLIKAPQNEEPRHVTNLRCRLRSLRNRLLGSGDHPWVVGQLGDILEAYECEAIEEGANVLDEATLPVGPN